MVILPISRPRFFYYDEAGLTVGYSEVEGGVMNMLAAQTPYAGTVADVEVQANAMNNTLIVGSGDDTVVGLGGDDLISGDAGDDVLYGNNCVDSVAGGDGDDQIFLGEGGAMSGSSELADASQMLGDDVTTWAQISCLGIKVLMYLMRQTVSLLRIQPYPLLIMTLPIR